VTPEDHEIVLYYFPFNFMLGLGLSFFGLLVMGWDLIGMNQRKCRNKTTDA